MNFQEWITYALENKYFIRVNGKLKITNNLIREDANTNYDSSSVGSTSISVRQSATPSRTTAGNLEELYHQFIIDSKVPTRISNGRGGYYNGNRFSNKAAVEFARIMKLGIDYQALVLATRLYYEVTKECAVTITNYICDGGWRTKYYEVLKSAESNQLQEHIEEEIKGDSNTLDL